MNLLLAQTEQQTHDTKTLRFQVPNERVLCAKPGQFLTFQWTIDGQRVTRSYTDFLLADPRELCGDHAQARGKWMCIRFSQ